MEAGLDSTPLGRYRLIALLGQGGMADVYLACTSGLGGFQKLLVVKLARFTGDPLFSQMFLNEARLAAQLSHPNIVQTYEIGEEGTRHYIVMEYLDGANLARLRYRARKTGGVPPRMAIQILSQVLEGLDYAHSAKGLDGKSLKVVHRDLTPTNIVVTAHGEVKILDFGIAKAADSHSFTAMGKYSGKLQYMPPEQLRAESIDQRADIFSVGVILAESHLGARFWGDTPMHAIAKRLAEGDLPALPDDMPEELRRICGRALSPTRDERYPSAAAFKADLQKYLLTLGGPVGREELAAFVCEMCEEDRAKLQLVIDEQLARKSSLSVGSAPASDLPRFERTPVASIYNENVDTSIDEPELIIEKPAANEVTPTAPAPPKSANESAPPAAPKKKLPVAWIVAGGGVAVAAVAIAVALGGGSGAKDAPATVAPTAVPPPVAAAPATAKLEIIASPADAVLTLDGKQLGTNPYVASLPRDAQPHELVVSASGYAPSTRKFSLESDVLLQLTLERTAPPPTPPPVAAAVVAPTRAASPPIARTVAKKAIAPTTTPPPPAPPAPAPPAATTVVAKPAASDSTTGKRPLDDSAYAPAGKRALDTNAYGDPATKAKPTLDRDDPYGSSKPTK